MAVKDKAVKDKNEERYNQLWQHSDIQPPQIWSTWKTIKTILGEKNLEVGPGNYPKIPLQNNYFLDISQTAVSNLEKAGAEAFLGSVEKIDFPDNFFDSLVAFDVLEHVRDDQKAFTEIARVLKPGGFFLFSVPLDKERFSRLDKIAGHQRRYEIEELISRLTKNKFKVVKWRAPSLKYSWIGISRKLPFGWKIFLRAYGSRRSFKFFHLPKGLVNFLVRIVALVDRISAPAWQERKETLKDFQGEGIILLSQKTPKTAKS